MARLKLELQWQDVAKILGVQNPNDPNEAISPEISDAVIGIFAERYLKGIAQEQVVQRAVVSVNNHVSAEIEKAVGTWKEVSSYPVRRVYKPTEELQRALDVVIANEREKIVKELTPFIAEQMELKLSSFEATINKRFFERTVVIEKKLDVMLSEVKEEALREELKKRVSEIISGLGQA